jgi:hypothetical protein
MKNSNHHSKRISVLYFSGIILFLFLFIVNIFIAENTITGSVSIGKPRNVDMEKIQRKLIEKKLSDKKALYFKILE